MCAHVAVSPNVGVFGTRTHRGVELVSVTNILGVLLLTPALVAWLALLPRLGVAYTLHDDTPPGK